MVKKDGGKKGRKNKEKSLFAFLKRHRKAVIIIVIILFIIIILAGAKIWLYFRLLLGNDVLVRLQANRTHITTQRGVQEQLELTASVETNLFCTAYCHSTIEDISNNITVDETNFTLKRHLPSTKAYQFSIKKLGEGQKILRATLECRSKNSFLCHTSEKETSREILITVDYELSDDERSLRDSQMVELSDMRNSVDMLTDRLEVYNGMVQQINQRLIATELQSRVNSLQSQLVRLNEELGNLIIIWDEKRYYLLENEKSSAVYSHSSIKTDMEELGADINSSIEYYNYLYQQMTSYSGKLEAITGEYIINETFIQSVNDAITSFNTKVIEFGQRTALAQKESLVHEAFIDVNTLENETEAHLRKESMTKLLEADIDYKLICSLTGECVERPDIEERAYQAVPSLQESCADSDALQEFYSEINSTLNHTQIEGYSQAVWDDAEKALAWLERQAKDDMTSILPVNGVNSQLISEILALDDASPAEAPGDAVTYLIISRDAACKEPETGFETVKEISLGILEKTAVPQNTYNFMLQEPKKQCCIFGECGNCCTTDECRGKEELYPVILVHGHSFNKNTEADYSLDAFNKIQKRLESDGFLNAGAISVYSPKEESKGVWSPTTWPLSIKASYYFDVFEEPHNYILIQTKSKNIDTYSIRLKELIDDIKEKTGRDKVNIVAHSMGGLVARKYMQLFGSEDVNKLIMIGTPNKGIRSSTYNYCSLIGEKLECEDMNSGSLFINKLNRAPLPNIDIYNIIGTGCDMKGQDGDGIVLKQDVYLEGTSNIQINGSCTTLNVLHTKMLDIDQYPEVYEAIISALKEGLDEQDSQTVVS